MKNINVKNKDREFISILNTHFQGEVNLSRLKHPFYAGVYSFGRYKSGKTTQIYLDSFDKKVLDDFNKIITR